MKILLRSDLPIKYYLNVHTLDQLIDSEAILFEITKYLIQVINTKEKDLTLENLKFSTKTLKYVFGDKIKDETFKEKLVKSLKELLKSELIISQKEFFYLTEKSIKNFYIISE